VSVQRHRFPIRRGPRVAREPIGDASDRHSLEAHIAEFLEWSEVHGFAETTIATRRRELVRFHGWLAERGVTRTGEVTKPMMDRYQRWLFHYRQANGQPLTFLTQKNRLMPLKVFFSWAVRTNRILYNPASDLEMPRVEHRLPKTVLSAAEVEAVMSQPNLGDPFGRRDRAILELFYATGIRRAELARLRWLDLDIDRRALSIRLGKGKKDRTVPVTQRALVWIQGYLDDVRPRLVVEPDEGFLFLTFDGQPLSHSYLTILTSRYVERAEIGKTGACHMLRHTMATLLLEGGADIRYIQAMLGHANLSSTQIYTRVSVTQLAAIVDACHPGARNEPSRDPQLDSDEASVLFVLDDDDSDELDGDGTDLDDGDVSSSSSSRS
jgi:integrase/recombinase XerD